MEMGGPENGQELRQVTTHGPWLITYEPQDNITPTKFLKGHIYHIYQKIKNVKFSFLKTKFLSKMNR